MRGVRQVIGLAAVLTMAACAPTEPTARQTAPAPSVSSPRATASTKVHVSSAPPKPKVIVSRFRAADGKAVTLARFRGAVHYRLHSGSQDPGRAALSVVRAGPSIGGRERRRLLAAFNGGFLLSAGAGGYEQEGHVISPLRRGLASIVIDRSGTARIGVWGSGLPLPHEAVFSVRQNLRLLVRHGARQPRRCRLDCLGIHHQRWQVCGAQRARRERGRRSHLRRRYVGHAGGPSGGSRACGRAHCHGTRHQSRMGPAGRCPPTGARPASSHPRPGPPG